MTIFFLAILQDSSIFCFTNKQPNKFLGLAILVLIEAGSETITLMISLLTSTSNSFSGCRIVFFLKIG
jgi:hypothetical protein